jgi:dTDP-4-amino-4,6-dideoxygalactose transaminase
MVPFLDLGAHYRSLKPEVDAAVLNVLASTQYVLGPSVAEFEASFAAYCGVDHAVGVNTGTSALHLALLAAGVGDGDEVITVSMTFVATTAAILYCGARPVFVDVDPATWTIDPNAIEAAITPRTKAILPVHLHGRVADMTSVIDIAARHGLVVIEDAAQAHGAEHRGRRAGSCGIIGCFSFYPGKNLGAYGEGGAAVTNDAELANRMRLLRDWGQEGKYNHVASGFNYRMDGLQGAVLAVKMSRIEQWTEARRRNAARYSEALSGLDLDLPANEGRDRHVWHVYAVRTIARDRLAAHLKSRGVATGIHYPVPVHLQKAYEEFGPGRGALPVSETLGLEFLSLPMFPEMTEAQIGEVVDAIRAARP